MTQIREGETAQVEEIKDTVRSYLLEEFLPGENPNSLTDTTPLITGGVLDSIASVKLVAHLGERYGIKFQAHEMSVAHLDTISAIASIVRTKISEK